MWEKLCTIHHLESGEGWSVAAASYQWFGWPGAQMAVTSVNVTHQVLWTHWPHMPGIVDVQNTSFTRQTLSLCVNICSIRCIYVHCRLENEAQMSAQCPGSLPLYLIFLHFISFKEMRNSPRMSLWFPGCGRHSHWPVSIQGDIFVIYIRAHQLISHKYFFHIYFCPVDKPNFV